MAAERGLLKVLQWILDTVGSDRLDDLRDSMGNNALHLAAGAACLPAASMLLEAGMSPDRTGQFSNYMLKTNCSLLPSSVPLKIFVWLRKALLALSMNSMHSSSEMAMLQWME